MDILSILNEKMMRVPGPPTDGTYNKLVIILIVRYIIFTLKHYSMKMSIWLINF